ncbi:MAG: L,D-transpeptidase family protein [Kiloniellales bacterium]|nr:L,D-transpeptidase family protein [Kiloniellales bacterium]
MRSARFFELRKAVGLRPLLIMLLFALPPPASAQPPVPAPEAERADRIVVHKAERRLILYRGETALIAYDIALGRDPEGHKQREGDGRTPEGRYRIDWRNPQSRYHLSLHVSYPEAADRARAAARGEEPGGLIMIHGLPNGLGALGAAGLLRDWTEGCIAVTNDAIRDIWRRVADGTPIEIRP